MIKAVILAAGLGTRLRELITDKPKCMVYVNGRPIISWQISALIAAGVTDIAIVTGHYADVIKDHIVHAFPEINIKLIHSDNYATTNNMYSLWITRAHVGQAALLFMNADVVFEPGVIFRLIEARFTAVAVDEGSYNEESMKVVRSNIDGYLDGISKKIEKEYALGSSIDVYYLQPADAQALYDECERVIQVERQCTQWSELALHQLLKTRRIMMRAVNISGLDWYEIDNPVDLAVAETLFSASALRSTPPRVYFLDLDGTVYIGSRDIEGAAAFVDHIRKNGAQVVFLSNNSSKSHSDYVKRLKSAGIESLEKDILLSTDALGMYLQENGITNGYIFGTSSMKSVLAGYNVAHTENNPQAILLGYHTQLTYDDIAKVALLLQNESVYYYASHLDMVCPTEHGPIPDAGALAELFFLVTGRRPDRIFGKPTADFVRKRIEALMVSPEECVVVGDRVYTDLALARATGTRFLGVLSGESRRQDFEGESDLMIASSIGHLFASTYDR